MQGWIKLHRKVTENELYFSERFTRAQAWIDLLLLATHKPQTVFIRGVEINLQPGELCYSQLSLAKRWKWNRKTVMAFLKLLERREMLLNRTDNRLSHFTTVLTVQHWCEYQSDGQLSGQRDGQRRDNGTDTIKKVKECETMKTPSEGEGFVFENELLKITARQLEGMRASYPKIKKFHPLFTRCCDVLREKQQRGEKINSPMAFLHSHLKFEQEKIGREKSKQNRGPDTRSGEVLSFEQITDKIAAHAEPAGGLTLDSFKKVFDLQEVT